MLPDINAFLNDFQKIKIVYYMSISTKTTGLTRPGCK